MIKLILFFILIVVYVHSKEPSASEVTLVKCVMECKKKFLEVTKQEAGPRGCTRGCKFYGIDMAESTLQPTEKRDKCYSRCAESNKESADLQACKIGCTTKVEYQFEDLPVPELVAISWQLMMEDENGIEFIHQSSDGLETEDVLSDPAMRTRVHISMVNNNNRLPELHVKTLPINSDEDEYDHKEWSKCLPKAEGMPICFAFSLILLIIAFGLWLMSNYEGFSLQQAPPLPPKYSELDELKSPC